MEKLIVIPCCVVWKWQHDRRSALDNIYIEALLGAYVQLKILHYHICRGNRHRTLLLEEYYICGTKSFTLEQVLLIENRF